MLQLSLSFFRNNNIENFLFRCIDSFASSLLSKWRSQLCRLKAHNSIKKDSGTSDFLRFVQNFSEEFLSWSPSTSYFWMSLWLLTMNRFSIAARYNPASIYLLKTNSGNTIRTCEIYLKSKINTSERRRWFRSESLLLKLWTLFFILFHYFYCWRWTDKYRLGNEIKQFEAASLIY